MNKNANSDSRGSVSTKRENAKSSEHSQSKKTEDAYFNSSRGEPAQVTAASYNR
ncbi:MAG: hypothetical protein PHC37_02130 [Candidatus Omnitrophica bacterium]|jgi:hypothetical protein|nr:hypothetical protein [Candidatus Omnitrophota bacterium]MDD5690485.1 hypothetical protein [Candidatus Omnitrophota bacterium]